MDYFEVFGLPRKLTIDGAALQQRFYELAREHHPDFHQSAAPEQRARAEEASAPSMPPTGRCGIPSPVPSTSYTSKRGETPGRARR